MTSTYTFTEYTPEEYLMIDIATNYGDAVLSSGEEVDLDKVHFDVRIQWFKEQAAAGNLVSLISSADSEPLFYAGLLAYNDMLEGEPTGYLISLDACASGIQILSVMSNCEKSASRCGVVPTGQREDAYTSLFGEMQAQSKTVLRATRKNLKQAIMTSVYGSTAIPKQLFGEGTPALELYYHILETELPGAWSLNLALQSLWQPMAENHSWEMPDGFCVKMDVEETTSTEVELFGEPVEVRTKENKGTKRGRSLGPNIVHSVDGMLVREITRRCSYDPKQVKRVEDLCMVSLARRNSRRKKLGGRKLTRPQDQVLRKLWDNYKRTGFLSMRIIDYIDEANVDVIGAYAVADMLASLPPKPFTILSIHDCFKAHPNYGNDIRRQYNALLTMLADGDLMSDLATQITGTRQKLVKIGSIGHLIKDADYALS